MIKSRDTNVNLNSNTVRANSTKPSCAVTSEVVDFWTLTYACTDCKGSARDNRRITLACTVGRF